MTSRAPNAHGTSVRLVGILLAAGKGSRFDASGARNKLLEPLNGQAVAAQSAANLRAVVDQLVVVCKPDSIGLAQALSDIDATLVPCVDAHLGMGHSLAEGVRQAQQRFAPSAVLVALADMPFIRRDSLERISQMNFAADTIAAPRYRGQRGHPVLFGAAHFSTLQASRGDTGASQLLKSPSVQWLELDDAGVLRDIDRPEDLR